VGDDHVVGLRSRPVFGHAFVVEPGAGDEREVTVVDRADEVCGVDRRGVGAANGASSEADVGVVVVDEPALFEEPQPAASPARVRAANVTNPFVSRRVMLSASRAYARPGVVQMDDSLAETGLVPAVVRSADPGG
jgi:hypothetical protein